MGACVEGFDKKNIERLHATSIIERG